MPENDDELEQLRRANPVAPGSVPSADSPRARALFEEITMSDDAAFTNRQSASGPSRRRWVGGIAAAIVLVGSGAAAVALRSSDGGEGATNLDAASQPGESNRYDNEVDGLSAAWPPGWHRAEGPLGGDRTPAVELLALTTFEGATAGQCSPAPDAAMAAMKHDDALLVIRTTETYQDPRAEDRPPRPSDLMAVAAPHPDAVAANRSAVQGPCFPPGVEAWTVEFQEHGRHYEAFVAARAPLSAERRRQLQEIWSGLELRPIETGMDEAEVGRPYWHVLDIHCGIKGTRFDGREWVADPELSDGQGNPPRGWSPRGVIRLTEENVAIFETRDGERSATFRPRTADDAPAPICQ